MTYSCARRSFVISHELERRPEFEKLKCQKSKFGFNIEILVKNRVFL